MIWIDENGRIVRPNDVQFGTDTFTAFHGKKSEPFLNAIRAWVRDGRGAREAVDARKLQLLPTPEHQLARAEFSVAWYLHRKGRTEAAEGHFNRAGELSPHDWTIRRGSMPIRGIDPMGPRFFELYQEWEAAGSPSYPVQEL